MRHRSDNNQAEIVKDLRAIGCTVLVVSALLNFDLLVGFRGDNYMLEIKQPGKKLRKEQQRFHGWWRGKIYKVESFDDCLEIIEKNE